VSDRPYDGVFDSPDGDQLFSVGERQLLEAEPLIAWGSVVDPMVPFALVASELARHLESHLSGSASMEDEAEAREVLAAFYALRASMVRQAVS